MTVCCEQLNHVVIYFATRQLTNDVSRCVKTLARLFVRPRSSCFSHFVFICFLLQGSVNLLTEVPKLYSCSRHGLTTAHIGMARRLISLADTFNLLRIYL